MTRAHGCASTTSGPMPEHPVTAQENDEHDPAERLRLGQLAGARTTREERSAQARVSWRQTGPDGPDVIGPAEAAQIIGVGPRRFQTIIRAYGERFPAARELEIGRVWDRAEIAAWAADRSGTQLAALRAYRRTGTVARAADVAGVSWSTAKKWLKTLRAL
jgi:hypothetical protein